MIIGKGSTERNLSSQELREIVAAAVDTSRLDGKRILVIIPDGTRTMPMPAMFALFDQLLHPRVKALDFLVALGTHPLMTDAQLSKLVGQPVVNEMTGDTHVFNHHWENPETFVQLGTMPAAEIRELTRGVMAQDVVVGLNKLILDYDHLLICGPVFPHEVVGFSGGNKYFFPGIASPEIINFTHWLGAVITNFEVIGAGYTPVRAVIDRAASLIPRPVACFAFVVTHDGVAGVYFGSPQEAWESASRLSARKHVIYVEKPFCRVLSIVPEMYRDLWTAGKGMYKVEPAVAEGGEVVIYAPHLTEISYTHGKLIAEIGYHCRDYFLKQWDRFQNYPGGILAHSTHVKGLGRYDTSTGNETSRIRVRLATGISEKVCGSINLGYLDPATIQADEWRGREREGILVVPRAGEILYRLQKNAQPVDGKERLVLTGH
jgi:nickel-dependent lactate racemase